MIDGAADIFEKCVGFVFNSLAREQPQMTQQEESWVPIDRPQTKGMSLYKCESKHQMGVYYSGGVSVDSNELESAYSQIEKHIPDRGQHVASSLLEPFQSVQSGNMKDACLDADVINLYFSTLQSNDVATIDSGLYANGAMANLSSFKKQQIFNKINAACLTLWPVCIGEHWYLMLIEKFQNNTFTINVLDSNNNKERHSAIANEGKNLLSSVYGDGCFRVLNEAYPSCLIPLQDNPIDSGTAIAYYAHKRTQRDSLSQYGQYAQRFCSYLLFRMHMALEIAKAAVANLFVARTTQPTPIVPSYYAAKTRTDTPKSNKTDTPKRARVIKVI